MIITREKGMRMWGGGSGNTSVSGASSGGGFSLTVAEGEGTGNAYTDFTYESGTLTLNKATEFVTVDFFNKLFTAYDANGTAIVPNDTTTAINNLKLMVGTWTEEYLSALGKNSEGGGGGGGIELSDVWQSLKTNTDDYANQKINSAHIPDLSGTYATKTWVNQQGFVTSSGVTSVAMTVPTGLAISGSPITTTGTLALTFATGYSIPTTAKQGNWDTAYGWGNHATAGYAMAATNIIAGNGLTGGGTIAADRTLSIQLQSNSGLAVSSLGLKLDIINNLTTESAYKAISATQAKKIWDLLNQMFTLEGAGTTASPYVIKANYGLYTEQFLSALGQNSSGGGGGNFDEAQMWTALQSTSGTYGSEKIAITHIPDMASTYGYLKSSALNGYATQAWVNQQGFLTTHQTLYTLSIYGGTTKVLDFKPNANASIYIKAGGDISLTNDTTNKYITLSYTHPTNGANTTISAASGKVLSAITVNNLGHVTSVSSKTLAAADIPDISATYATAARATTLEGYFTNGVANTAAKLNTGTTTYSAWGQTYWSSGVPQDVDGTLTISGGELMIWNTANTSAENRWDMRFMCSGDVFQMWAYEGAYHDLAIGNTAAATATYKGLYYDASEKRWGIGTTTPAYAFDVQGNIGATGAITLAGTSASTRRIYFGDTSHYIELTSTGFHFSHGIYSDSFVSALGSNSSGGGSGTFDEEAMWTALGTTSTAKVIASSHIPNLSASKITSGTFAAARIPNLSWTKITSDKPTTLSGYGITNAYTKTQVDNALSGYLPLSGGTITGNLVVNGTTTLDDYLTTKTYIDVDRSPYGAISLGYQLNVLRARCMNAGTGTFAYNSVISLFGSGETGTTVNNLGVRLGSTSGATWISAGESGKTLSSQYTDMCNTESVYITADNQIKFFTNCSNDGTSFTDAATINSSGDLTVARYVYATSFHGALSGNATTATTLANPRSIWGQNFNGSANITGDLSSVTSITMSGNLENTGGNINLANGKYINWADNEGTNRTMLYMTTGNAFSVGYGTIGTGSGTIVIGTNIYLRANSTSANTVYISSAGNVGIGTGATAPSQKLDVEGNIIASGYVAVGTGGTNSYIASDSANNIYLKNSECTPLVCVGKVVRRGSASTNDDVTLGSSDKPWGGLYSTTGDFSSTLSVTGASTLTGNITAGGDIYLNNAKYIRANNSSGTAEQLMGMNGSNQLLIGYGHRTSGQTILYGLSLSLSTNGSTRVTITNAGNVGVANSSPSEKLHVTGNILASGEVTASSDERKKNIISNTKFNVRDIASARSILYEWNDDRDKDNEKKIHGGSIAQDWLGKADSFLSQDNDGWYSINYGALALCSAITIAREVLKHSDEIDRLKQEVSYLKARVAELEERRA